MRASETVKASVIVKALVIVRALAAEVTHRTTALGVTALRATAVKKLNSRYLHNKSLIS